MNTKLLLATIGSISLFLGSQAVMADEWDALILKDEIKKATAEIDNAKAAGFEWRDSRKMLKKAQKLSDDGKTEEAQKLVKKAMEQGKIAAAQAKDQMHADPH